MHVGGQDGTLRTFDTTSWELTDQHVLSQGFNALRLAEPSPNGSQILVPSYSGEVFIVDPLSGAPIGEPFITAGTQLEQAVLAMDAQIVAAQGNDGRLRLWDVATQRPIGPALDGHPEGSATMQLGAGDTVMSIGSGEGQLIRWNLDPGSWVERACRLAGRNLTRAEWEVYIGGPYQRTCSQWDDGE